MTTQQRRMIVAMLRATAATLQPEWRDAYLEAADEMASKLQESTQLALDDRSTVPKSTPYG